MMENFDTQNQPGSTGKESPRMTAQTKTVNNIEMEEDRDIQKRSLRKQEER